jgi:hypothetical protein
MHLDATPPSGIRLNRSFMAKSLADSPPLTHGDNRITNDCAYAK